jgi:glycosyl hydrolase family 62
MPQRIPIPLILSAALLGAASWKAGPPIFTPGPSGAFDETAVKDPSVIYYAGKWHLFYTARGHNEYTIGYAAASTLEGLRTANRTWLTQLRSRQENYAAAPQVFYFRPHRKWYLIFQTRDSNYQPVYSTTSHLDQPASWSRPLPLVEKRDKAKWIDFWVICDAGRAWFFFTRSQRHVNVMSTPLADFPHGWDEMKPVFAPVAEAVHVYRDRGRPRYVMLFETARGQIRQYGLAESAALAGPWRQTTDEFATGTQLVFETGVSIWTQEVSHGELLRSGFNERLEVDAAHLRFLIQGLTLAEHHGEYPSLPWKLGIIDQR